MVNYLMLSGTVYKKPICKVSPSGIPHLQFILEHHSIQNESGFSRKAWCKLPVVVSGKYIIEMTKSMLVGTQITIKGFISCHQWRNGFSKIVLHAEKIDFINFGD